MAFDWITIAEAGSAEMRLYRLLGEMLQRQACDDDLDRLRRFLAAERPGIDVWHSLGEALFHTTRGRETGYRLWTAWARATAGDQYDEGQMLAAWQRMRIDVSESLEENTEDDRWHAELHDPPTLQIDEFDEFDELDEEGDELLSRTGVLGNEAIAPPITSVLADSPARLMSYLPSGPYTIRVLDEVYEDVDEFTLLALLRRGMFLGMDVLFGARWVRVEEHPAFETIIRSMKREARRVLATQSRVAPEATQPGV